MFRFAPSPTKDMHIGNLREALFNFIVSYQKDEKLHIRIENTDTKQNIDEKVQEILEILALFGISWSEVTYQSHNLKFHQQLATKLLMDKNAFSCYCTNEDIDRAKEYILKHSLIPLNYLQAFCIFLTISTTRARENILKFISEPLCVLINASLCVIASPAACISSISGM